MDKIFYPAIFEEERGKGFSIYFPDIEGCFTQSEDMADGYRMANDVLGLSLSYLEDNNIELPKASAPNAIELKDNQFVVVVEFDMFEYKKRNDSRAVKKTLTIPSWLNELAIAQNVNFSQALQEILMLKVKK